MATARPICLLFDRQVALRALSRAWANTGKRIAARMAMMAMTTSSSMRVKARRRPMIGVLLPQRGRTAAGAPVGLPRSPSGSRCAEDLLPGNQPRTGRHLSEDEWGALLLEARLGNRHCVRAIFQVDVNRLARVVPGVAIRGQKVA